MAIVDNNSSIHDEQRDEKHANSMRTGGQGSIAVDASVSHSRALDKMEKLSSVHLKSKIDVDSQISAVDRRNLGLPKNPVNESVGKLTTRKDDGRVENSRNIMI